MAVPRLGHLVALAEATAKAEHRARAAVAGVLCYLTGKINYLKNIQDSRRKVLFISLQQIIKKLVQDS